MVWDSLCCRDLHQDWPRAECPPEFTSSLDGGGSGLGEAVLAADVAVAGALPEHRPVACGRAGSRAGADRAAIDNGSLI